MTLGKELIIVGVGLPVGIAVVIGLIVGETVNVGVGFFTGLNDLDY